MFSGCHCTFGNEAFHCEVTTMTEVVIHFHGIHSVNGLTVFLLSDV